MLSSCNPLAMYQYENFRKLHADSSEGYSVAELGKYVSPSPIIWNIFDRKFCPLHYHLQNSRSVMLPHICPDSQTLISTPFFNLEEEMQWEEKYLLIRRKCVIVCFSLRRQRKWRFFENCTEATLAVGNRTRCKGYQRQPVQK